jgi:pimeloyl-ACP methyl ester carboxylesterase
MCSVTEPESGAEVETLLRTCGVPRRRGEPRLAPGLAAAQKQLIPTADGTIAAWRVGADPAVLLVHGWEDDNSLWAPLIDALAARGRSVVVLDMPAHGFSEGEWGLNPQAVDAVVAVSEALGPVDALAAHSSGAGVAILAIYEGLAVDRAVLIAPPLRSDNRWERYAARLGLSPEVAARAQAVYREWNGPAREAFVLRSALPSLEVELLVIHSVDDERMPFADSEELVRQCRRAELLRVEGLNHRKTARDPGVVARIAEFLGDHRSERTR